MGAAETLAAWGILRAPEVVEIAAGAGLELASAATMLEKESSGGLNLWGRDGVQTGGFYVKGSTVTRAAYEAWLPNRSRLGSQGVGPCQLTYPPLQDQADRLGGCWDWRINVTVGCRHLAGLQRQYGLRDGLRRYNGSGPAAEAYADDAMKRRQKWIDRLGAAGPPTTAKDWFDMASLDDLRNVVREVCGTPAQRADIAWARDQQAAVLDFDPKASPDQLAAGPSVIGLLQQLIARPVEDSDVVVDAAAAAPLDYDRLARSMVAVLLETASAHTTDPADPASDTQTPI